MILKTFGFCFMVAVLVADVIVLFMRWTGATVGFVLIIAAVVGGVCIARFNAIDEVTVGLEKIGSLVLRLRKETDFVVAKAEEARQVERRIGDAESSFRDAMKALVEHAVYSYAPGRTKEQIFKAAFRKASALIEISRYAFTDPVEQHTWMQKLIEERDRLSGGAEDQKADKNPN